MHMYWRLISLEEIIQICIISFKECQKALFIVASDVAPFLYDKPCTGVQGLLRKGAISDATIKRLFLAVHFKNKSYLGFFLNLVPKESFGPLGYILNKVNRSIAQNPGQSWDIELA